MYVERLALLWIHRRTIDAEQFEPTREQRAQGRGIQMRPTPRETSIRDRSVGSQKQALDGTCGEGIIDYIKRYLIGVRRNVDDCRAPDKGIERELFRTLRAVANVQRRVGMRSDVRARRDGRNVDAGARGNRPWPTARIGSIARPRRRNRTERYAYVVKTRPLIARQASWLSRRACRR